ncbi:uncharacterized protein SPSK_00625 [Sporothrix schenckii 1099-18]|uniref:Uncharacterized protein n=1 Tax=Sporothrix schenckii 1099-18 TaxID=1397361 RepID=A0A0F2LR34_SPOSC|nr:uncharacterized protein SPSK_00625 [Sporothrix schenckii 1099-18]KJR79967.1 hypothetical protein SPSK_00625 [Sporothrix schenckii 1099-18]
MDNGHRATGQPLKDVPITAQTFKHATERCSDDPTIIGLISGCQTNQESPRHAWRIRDKRWCVAVNRCDGGATDETPVLLILSPSRLRHTAAQPKHLQQLQQACNGKRTRTRKESLLADPVAWRD